MKYFTFLFVFAVAVSTQAAPRDSGSAQSKSVARAKKQLKTQDTRVVVNDAQSTDGNPCEPEGRYKRVELQVRLASYDRIKNQTVYSWETVKVIVVDKDGAQMEVCAE